MIKAFLLTVFALVVVYGAVCMTIVYEEHGKWDHCDQLMDTMKFRPSAHTPTGC